ncbi:MAG: inositol monophosphatase family protein, partial [Pseudomonadota bacterium]
MLVRAAARAKELSARRAELSVDQKSAGQFVSDADTEIEHRLREEISRAFGDVPIIGEETGGGLSADATGWAIDPIDGTSNFLLGLPIWGISVGYLEQGRSRLGAVALPDLNLLISARDGHGLRLNRAPAGPGIHAPSIKVMALGENEFESGTETDRRAEALRQAGFAVVRYRCAVFALSQAALGRLSGYVEVGCGLWDVAAAIVICREAGLTVQSSGLPEGVWQIDARWPA